MENLVHSTFLPHAISNFINSSVQIPLCLKNYDMKGLHYLQVLWFSTTHIQQLQLWWMEKKPRLTNLMDIRKGVMNSCKSQKKPQCHLVKQIFCPQLDNTSQRGKGSNQLKHIYISLSYDIINPTFILGKMMIFVWRLKLLAKKTINMETAQEK